MRSSIGRAGDVHRRASAPRAPPRVSTPHGLEAPHRSAGNPHGSCRSAPPAPGRARRGRKVRASTTHSSRWWRPPVHGTSWQSNTRPGGLSRTRRFRGHSVGLPSKPGRGFCQDLPLRAQLPVLFSRRSCWISSFSWLVSPSRRRPLSRSACWTQFRMVWADGSNSLAKDSGLRPARTNSIN